MVSATAERHTPRHARRGRARLPEPASIQELIVSRLKGLERNDVVVCETVAVAGREVTVARLRRLTGMLGVELLDSIDVLRRKQIMEDDNPELVRFTHAKLRNAVYAQIPQTRRARLHREVAHEQLKELDLGQSASLASLAYHWEQGGVPERARRAYLQAARAAALQYAQADAERTFRKVIQLSSPSDPEAIMARLDLVEQVLLDQGRSVEARGLLEAASQMAAARDDAALRARATFLNGRALDRLGRTDEAIDALQQAHDLFQELDDLKGQGSCLLQIGKLTSGQGHLTRARGLHERAAKLLAEADDLPGADRAHGELATIYYGLGRHDDALALLTRLLSAADERDDHRSQGELLVRLAEVHRNLGHVDLAEQELQQALATFRRMGHRDGEGEALLGLAGLLSQSGHYAEALSLCEQAHALLESIGHPRRLGLILAQMAQISTRRGDLERAEQLARDALMASRQVRDQQSEIITLTRLAEVYRHRGHVAEAQRIFNRLLPRQRAVGDLRGEAQTLYRIGRLLRDLGRLEEAHRPLSRSISIASKLNERLLLARARLTRASIHRYQGHLELAAGTLELARDLMHRSGAPLGLIGVYVEAGFLALAQGQDAKPALRQALAIIDRLEMGVDSLGARHARELSRAMARTKLNKPMLAGQSPADLPQLLRQHLQANRSGASFM